MSHHPDAQKLMDKLRADAELAHQFLALGVVAHGYSSSSSLRRAMS